MGYRSDLRFILKRKDFEELKEKMNKYYKDKEWNLFEEDELIIVEENNNWVKFGWNGLKWYYPQYEEVKLIQDFITSKDQYYMARLGEDYGDFEEEDNLEHEEDCPDISYVYHYLED